MQQIKASPGLGVRWLLNANLINELRGPWRLCHLGCCSKGHRETPRSPHRATVLAKSDQHRHGREPLASAGNTHPPPCNSADDREIWPPGCRVCPRSELEGNHQPSETGASSGRRHDLCHLRFNTSSAIYQLCSSGQALKGFEPSFPHQEDGLQRTCLSGLV